MPCFAGNALKEVAVTEVSAATVVTNRVTSRAIAPREAAEVVVAVAIGIATTVARLVT